MVDVVGGTTPCHLLALGGDGREAELFQVVLEEDDGLGFDAVHVLLLLVVVAHDAPVSTTRDAPCRLELRRSGLGRPLRP